jgi:hypothetical protein
LEGVEAEKRDLIMTVEGGIFAGQFHDAQNQLVWFSKTTWVCGSCKKRQRTLLTGEGEIPKEFPVVCKNCNEAGIVIPYKPDQK